MSFHYETPLVDQSELAQARAVMGAGMARILGYFREDGARSIRAIEEAFTQGNAAAMVIPAHTLKGESLQFGARRLGGIAESIEQTARRCVEQRLPPSEVGGEVAMLRGCFNETLALLESAAPPSGTSRPAVPGAAGTRPVTFGTAPRTFGRRTG